MRYTYSKYNFKKYVRFRKWSRKAYSTFLSFCYQVSIGHVCKAIADSAITKNKCSGVCSSFQTQAEDYAESYEYKAEDDLTDILSDMAVLRLYAGNLLPVSVIANRIADYLNYFIYKPLRESSCRGIKTFA